MLNPVACRGNVCCCVLLDACDVGLAVRHLVVSSGEFLSSSLTVWVAMEGLMCGMEMLFGLCLVCRLGSSHLKRLSGGSFPM